MKVCWIENENNISLYRFHKKKVTWKYEYFNVFSTAKSISEAKNINIYMNFFYGLKMFHSKHEWSLVRIDLVIENIRKRKNIHTAGPKSSCTYKWRRKTIWNHIPSSSPLLDATEEMHQNWNDELSSVLYDLNKFVR